MQHGPQPLLRPCCRHTAPSSHHPHLHPALPALPGSPTIGSGRLQPEEQGQRGSASASQG